METRTKPVAVRSGVGILDLIGLLKGRDWVSGLYLIVTICERINPESAFRTTKREARKPPLLDCESIARGGRSIAVKLLENSCRYGYIEKRIMNDKSRQYRLTEKGESRA